MPCAKNGERPYPEAPKWHFWDPCLGLFLRYSGIPNPTRSLCLFLSTNILLQLYKDYFRVLLFLYTRLVLYALP